MYVNDTAIVRQVSSTANNFHPKPPERELYIQIKDDVVDQVIRHGLSRAESKLFFYLFKLDRFGDRPVKVKVAEILLGAGIGRTAYHAAIVKFEKMGWFQFTHADAEISNFCTPTKLSANANTQSANANSKKLKAVPSKVSKTPQTIQTYSDLLQTLPEGQRESFEKFCLKKIEECSFPIASREAWLNKRGAEYLREFKDKYSEALANPELIAPKVDPSMLVDIPFLQRMYGDNWEEAANHFGYIIQNSPAVEIQNEERSTLHQDRSIS